MIQIQLKAKHFYYIAYYLKDKSIIQYYNLVGRIKGEISGNTDMETLFSIDVYPWEIIDIFKILTRLPEGQATMLNGEMMDILQTQMVTGITNEMMNGIVPSQDGSLPENAYWQIVAAGVTGVKVENFQIRDKAIQQGKQLIDQI